MAELQVHERLEGMSLEEQNPDQADTPETAQFRALPQELQRRLLSHYPRLLATAMHQYGCGADCEAVLLGMFEQSSELLRVRNTEGDTAMAAALVRAQDERAEKLVDLADRRQPAVLDSRTRFGESLLMLSTASSSSAGRLMERLLRRDPTQLHRLYDLDGRNFLHHCALEDSADTLDAALRLTAELIREGRLSARQVAAAVHMNDRLGDTPMHAMAARNRSDMLGRLLRFCDEVGIDVRVDERQHRDRRWTPLMAAVAAGAAEAAELLADRGADPEAEDTEGQTALQLAAGNDRLLRILVGPEEAAAVPEAAAVVAAAPVTEAWLKADPGASGGPEDSGVGTCGLDLQAELEGAASPVPSNATSNTLASEEVKRLVDGLRGAGKEAAFLDAFQAEHAGVAALARMSESPAALLVAGLAHDPRCRDLVRCALRRIGEPGLAAGL